MVRYVILLGFLLLLLNSNAAAQSESVEISAKELLSAVNKAKTHVMFSIKKGKLYILDQDRKALFPEDYKAPDQEVFYVYTVDYVKNYIKQLRAKKIKFTKDYSGNVILGDGASAKTEDLPFDCPPYCP